MTPGSRDGRDTRSAVALALIVIAALAASLIHRLDLSPAPGSPIIDTALGIGGISITAALVRQRQIAVRRGLSSRTYLSIVPADEFATDPESVFRFASQLARTEPVVAGWLSRPARAIRVRLAHDEDGRLTYSLGVPDTSLEVVREALRGYRGIEVSEVEPPVFVGDDDSTASARVELVLARPSVEPLRTVPLVPDPLLPFAAAFDGTNRGEASAAVCVDLLPATGVRQRRLRRVLRRQARHLHRHRPDLVADLLEGGAGGRPSPTREPVDNAERRDASAALDAKLRDAGPLFEAQVLLRASAPHPAQAKAEVERLLAAFAPLGSSRNWLRASGLRVPGLAFLGSDLPIRRARFDRRFASGLFRPARRNVLTTRELLGLLKPPTEDLFSENVVRSGALLPDPPDLPDFDPSDGSLIPLGRVRGEQGERIVGIRTADTFFTYVAGRSRFGKTEWAIAAFVQRVLSGEGGLFLDPAGDALDRIRPYLTDPAVARRVVEIDLGPGRTEVAQPGWNLFELRGSGPEESEARVEAVVDAFASALGWGERSTRAINLMTQAASALATVARLVDPAIAPTIFQIPTLLTDEDWREAVVPLLPRSSQEFWRARFGRLSEEAITPVTNIIDRLRASRASATLLGQSEGSYSARSAMDEGKIVLAAPGTGGARSRLTANLIVFDVFYSAIARGATPAEQRRLFNLYCDEVQTFDGGETKLPSLIEVGAKYGVRGTFLNQNPERLSAATLNALTTNRSVLLTSNLNAPGARLMAREFGGEPNAEAISRLPRYAFVGQVTDRGTVSAPFAVGGIRVEDALGFEGDLRGVDALREASAEATKRRTPGEAIAHLEKLDEAILDALEGLPARPRIGAGPPEGYRSGTRLDGAGS
jgi:hypothetical protein